ncbi:MAG: CamS family sex pheromone protein [Holdemanella sp.]|nr:CamS family sex pheromone protein [Holdemanella sp.]
MRKGKKLIGLMLAFMLSGCSFIQSTNTVAVRDGEYAAKLPYTVSNSRIKHASLISDFDNRVAIESGLMELSKDYFSPSEVEYTTHAFLDFDELDATDGSRGLLGTLRDNNPIGLNPSRDEEFDTGNGIVTGSTILVDIYELDWYAGNQLKGISIALVVNGELLSNGQSIPIEEKQMASYVEVTSNKLVSYMRERFNEITSRVPVFVAAYSLGVGDDIEGGYFKTGYFTGTQGKFEDIKEEWVLMPSTPFTNIDSNVALQFSQYQESVQTLLSDYTFVTGKAKATNNEITEMNIEVRANAKSAGEILAIMQISRESLSYFTSTNCKYTVRVLNDENVYGIIQRRKGSNTAEIISTI